MTYMTMADLDRLNALRRDIEQETEALRNIHGHTQRTAAIIPAIQEDLEHKKALFATEMERVEGYVSEVEDDYIRSVLTDRFLNGLPWHTVVRKNPGYGRKAASEKARHYVYQQSCLCRPPRRVTV